MLRPHARSWVTSRASLLTTFVALFILVSIWTTRIYGDALNLEALRNRLPSNLNPLRNRPASPFRNTTDPVTHHLLPPKIWQISLPKNPADPAGRDINPESLQDAATWLAKNPDYAYTLVDNFGGETFVRTHFSHRPDILAAYQNMPNVGMKSDLLRYLLLYIEGGVYTDTDTVAIKPIDKWIPEEFRSKAKVVVGIEFDRLDGGAWADINHWVQFCQWTIAAAPGHPVFMRMVDRVLASLEDLSKEHHVPVDHVKPTSFEVMNSTGPAAWTDVVFEELRLAEGWLSDTKDLSGMPGARMFGDVLVLTVNGFGMGQLHSGSVNNGTVPEEEELVGTAYGGKKGLR
ncbi:alpha-mannosyltransferase och1 [Podospora aff. communis PSN243]|uniref:Alpha-mannosyltransferase och1 n=1 Tax=Podospora aff. communis PSN243 TaxID=3040156 RepID=A0AAV9H5A3_9PEZI|nr:alpha-mannosyltransferase och1 [Podospora aff. communis PSN243]